LLGWVVGYLGRLWPVTLVRLFPGVRRKAPKSGALSTEDPSRTLPGPHQPYPTWPTTIRPSVATRSQPQEG